MKTKTIIIAILIGLGYLILFAYFYKSLEKPSIYNRFFSSFMPTYEVQNNSIIVVNKPFVVPLEKSYVENMDAFHYACIKNNLYNYDPNDEVSRSIFAFFPLFPVMWKITDTSGKEITIINFLLHLVSIIILVFVFCKESTINSLLVILSLPTLTVFLLPYSEALFMFSISIALLGWKKNNILLYVSGLLFASMTRPVFILLIGSVIATELFFLLCERNRKIQFKHIIITISSILTGTFLVILFQWNYHHSSLFTFVSAQRHWGTFLQFPKAIVDWSNEGYGMNVWAMLFCFVFGGAILISKLIPKKVLEPDPFDYWYYFSWIYLFSAIFFVLFLQGGCLHSIYRYVLCSPFFYIIVFQHISNLYRISSTRAFLIFLIFILSCILFIKNVAYGSIWNFSKTGFVLLCINLFFFLLMKNFNSTIKYIGFSILIAFGIAWNCYLLNMFLARAWIFL